MLKIDGAQWMTKGVKDAETKKVKDLREQRKQYKAAGLRSGEVPEACPVPAVAGGAGQACVHQHGDRDVGLEASGGGRILADKNKKWRKIAPEEMPGKGGNGSGGSVQKPPSGAISEGDGVAVCKEEEKGAHTPSGEGRAAEKKRKEAVLLDTGAPAASENSPGRDGDDGRHCKRGKVKKEQEQDKDEGGKRVVAPVSKRAGKQRARVGEEDGEGGKGGKGVGGGTPLCEFQSCAKAATFGVNGAVRYW